MTKHEIKADLQDIRYYYTHRRCSTGRKIPASRILS